LFRNFPASNVTNDRQHERLFLDLQWTQHDIDGEFRAVFAEPVQLEACAHGPGMGLRGVGVAVTRMTGAKTFGQQAFDRLTNQLRAWMAKHRFRLLIGPQDSSLAIHDKYRVGREFEQFFEQHVRIDKHRFSGVFAAHDCHSFASRAPRDVFPGRRTRQAEKRSIPQALCFPGQVMRHTPSRDAAHSIRKRLRSTWKSGGTTMSQDKRDLLTVLRSELEFLEKGGYRTSARADWRPQFVFQDSPTCLNFDSTQPPQPCSECKLMYFIPADAAKRKIPCRFIPLNDRGETIDSFYRCGTAEELVSALGGWLRSAIERLETVPWRKGCATCVRAHAESETSANNRGEETR